MKVNITYTSGYWEYEFGCFMTQLYTQPTEDAGISKTINDDILGRRLMV